MVKPATRLGLLERMRGSEKQVQFGKAQMSYRTAHRTTVGDRCPCNCYIRHRISANSVCHLQLPALLRAILALEQNASLFIGIKQKLV